MPGGVPVCSRARARLEHVMVDALVLGEPGSAQVRVVARVAEGLPEGVAHAVHVTLVPDDALLRERRLERVGLLGLPRRHVARVVFRI